MIRVDKTKKIAIVKRGSVITKSIKFDGTIISGMNCSFLGDVIAKEIKLMRNCVINGEIKCDKLILGSNSQFNTIEAKEVLILSKCTGEKIKASGDVRITDNCKINEISANRLIIEGNSKVDKVEAKKVIALSHFV